MKKKSLLIVVALLFVTAANTAIVSASTLNETYNVLSLHTPDRCPLQPVWTLPHFTNSQIEARLSNNALSQAIEQFYNQNHTHITRIYQGADNQGRYPIDPYMNQIFRNTLSRGFQTDSISRTMPFNSDFLNTVLENTYFYLARPNNLSNYYMGTYTNWGATSYIFVSVRGTAPEDFTFVTLHELGHALGLGETLADLFAEEFMGIEGSVRLEENLAYNSTFDRLLLNRTGPIRFWDAAFRCNSAFEALWDENFSSFITHREMQTIRGLTLATIPGTFQYKPGIASTFEEFTNTPLHLFSRQFHTDFLVLAEHGQSQPQLGEAARFRDLVTIYTHFSQLHDIAPSKSVWDFALDSHRSRHMSNSAK